MTTYRSVPVEVEAMQWHGSNYRHPQDPMYPTQDIVDWVNTNGGDAHIAVPHEGVECDCSFDRHGPRIAVRTINGWAYAVPGHYVVKGNATFAVTRGDNEGDRQVLDHYPCDPATFEKRWVVSS